MQGNRIIVMEAKPFAGGRKRSLLARFNLAVRP
jgi:hypothetical protein